MKTSKLRWVGCLLLAGGMLRAAEPAAEGADASAKGGDTVAPPAETQAAANEAAAQLQALADRQTSLAAKAATMDSENALRDLNKPFQDLVDAYKDFLAKHPDMPEGHVSYGQLLKQPVVDERRRAVEEFLQANKLYGDMSEAELKARGGAKHWALVKNAIGNYVAEEGHPLDAINYFLAAVRLQPAEALYHYQVGNLLAVARDDFLGAGDWTSETLDQSMQDAYRRATELAPGNFAFGYGYAKSFYIVTKPDWNAALAVWTALEAKTQTPLARQTVQLHEAKVLMELGRKDEARAKLGGVTAGELVPQRDQLRGELGS